VFLKDNLDFSPLKSDRVSKLMLSKLINIEVILRGELYKFHPPKADLNSQVH